MIQFYQRHGADVAVQAHLKGLHQQYCLCYSGCKKFKPGQLDNCNVADLLYHIDKELNMVTPVWECPKFQKED